MALIRTASSSLLKLQRPSAYLFSKALKDCRPCSLQYPYSTNPTNLNLSADSAEGIAVVELKRKPVNGLNLELLTELTMTLEKLENDRQINGLVITSAQPKIFSAGLDIMEMYNPKPERLREFWRTLQNFWMKLYISPLATVAAINMMVPLRREHDGFKLMCKMLLVHIVMDHRAADPVELRLKQKVPCSAPGRCQLGKHILAEESGHSPAGGCLIALSCDHRVMASGNYAIGLNETLLGIVAPFWFMDSMRNVVGQRESERALQLGKLYSADEALKLGLVDEVVPESAVVQHAKEELAKWLQVPGHARQLTKLALRKPTVDKLVARQDEDIENFASFVTKDSIQKGLAKYLEALKRKN